MATEQELKQAASLFKTLCDYLDENTWNYKKADDSLGVTFGTKGDDLPIPIIIRINPELMVLSIYATMPFEIPEDMRVPMVVAVTAATHCMVDGGFDYDVKSGKILFRITSTFRESIIGKKLIEYMLGCACVMTDEFNDKFYKMVQEKMSAGEMLDMIYKEA